jgi:hypothetical protein
LAKPSDCPDVLLETRDAIDAILNLAMSAGSEAATQALHQLRQALADSAVRLGELRDYALDQARAQQLCDALAGPDGKASLQAISDNSVLMGWSIGIQRR